MGVAVGIKAMKMIKLCVLFGLLAVTAAYPLAGTSDVELLDESATWSTRDASAEVQAMNDAVKNVKTGSTRLNRNVKFEKKVMQNLDDNEAKANTQAGEVTKLAKEVPKEWTKSSKVDQELKASTVVAGTLMSIKEKLRQELKDTAGGVEDAKKLQMAKGTRLGEAKDSTLKLARKHAKLWLEGRKLANRELELEKKEGKASGVAKQQKAQLRAVQGLAKRTMSIEQKEHKAALKMSKQIDEAGAVLNKWYDAHDTKKAPSSELYKSKAKLGETWQFTKGPLNDAQHRIEKAAEKSIMEVANTAKKAMLEAASSNKQTNKTTDKKKTVKKKTVKKKTAKKKTAKKKEGVSFASMKHHVNKVAKDVGLSAGKIAKEQAK